MALAFNWRLTAIELLPFGGVAKVDEHGNRPFKEEFLVTIAGPIQHLWLPLVSFALLRTHFWNESNHHLFLTENTLLLVFNLLPIWPLDGGKLLFLLLAKLFPFKKAFRSALVFSLLFLFSLLIAIAYYNHTALNFFVIAIFIGFSIHQEWRQQKVVFMRFLLERWRTRPVEARRSVRKLRVGSDWPIWRVFDLFFKDPAHYIYINGHRVDEAIHETALLEAYFGGKYLDRTIGELINVS